MKIREPRQGRICAVLCILFLLHVGPAGAALVINEIMYNPSAVSDASGEWFEILNTGATVDLQGYAIADASASENIGGSLIIGPGGYLVFGRNPDTTVNGGVPMNGTFGFSLGNSGETLSLLDPTGNPLDSVIFGPGTGFPTSAGASICFTGVGDNSDGANWLNAEDLGVTYGLGDYGTPGEANLSAVPEPSSLFLIGSGLVGILVSRRQEHKIG